LIHDHKIDCGFQSKQSLYIAHNLKERERLLKEFSSRDQAGLKVSWLDKDEILTDYGLKAHGGILSQDAASVDAYKLAHELIHLNCERGLKVYDQTILENIEYKADGVVITTEQGHTINAKKIVFCTGYEATKMLKENIADIFYTWACISEEKIVLKEKLFDTLVWDTEDPYFYMRTTSEGRLLMGGEDSSYKQSILRQKIKEWKSKKLVKKVERLMPSIAFEEDFNWGGAFGSTKDGLPYIGVSPECQNAIFVLGFGGNGISFSVQGMDIIKDLLKDRPNELANYYRFGR
jgi:glycine/D-amino acid oxidase-like deaminating enzyme